MFLSMVGTIVLIILIQDFTALPEGLSILVAFLLPFFISVSALRNIRSHVGINGILIPMAIGILFMIVPKSLMSSIAFTLRIAPVVLTIVLGILAGYIYGVKAGSSSRLPVMISVLPLILTLGAYDLWVHKVEYGTFTGEPEEFREIQFEVEDKTGRSVSETTLKGKIVLLDFWFIGCRTCVVKFPDLQEIHERYSSIDEVRIYAVNRPMSRDTTGQLFSYIEDMGYNFPVLKGSQKVMDAFGVQFYPTVIVLNPRGEVVFMGELDDAEAVIEELLVSM